MQQRLRWAQWTATPIVAVAVALLVRSRDEPWKWGYLWWGGGIALCYGGLLTFSTLAAERERAKCGRTGTVGARQRLAVSLPLAVTLGGAAGVLSAAFRVIWFDLAATLYLIVLLASALLLGLAVGRRRACR